MSGLSLQDNQARDYLLSVLNERDISLGSDDISWAFTSDKTREELINWIKEYLQEHTLLTKDEAAFSQNISSSTIFGPEDAAERHGILLHDHHFKSAIDSLRQSTAMIDMHTKVLDEQRMALQEMGSEGQRNGPSLQAHGRSNGHDYNSLNSTVAGNMHDFEEEMAELEREAAAATAAMNALVAERLSADDQVLEAVSKLASLTQPDGGEAGGVDAATVEAWCQTLVGLRESEMNWHLDAAIDNHTADLAAALSPAGTRSRSTTGSSTVSAAAGASPPPPEDVVAAELRTLRAEIASVAALAVGAELRGPAASQARRAKRRAAAAQRAWVRYVADTLEHMVRQLGAVAGEAAALRAYAGALAQVRAAHARFAAGGGGGEPGGPQSSSSPSAASPSPTHAPPAPPFRPPPGRPTHASHASLSSASNASGGRQTHASHPSLSGGPTLAEQAWRRFALAGRRPDAARLRREALRRERKARAQYASATRATAEMLGAAVHARRRAVACARDELLRFSPYGTVRLADEAVERKIARLDGEVAEAAGVLERLGLGA